MRINKKDMEKTGIAILVVGIVTLAACTFGHHHTTVVEKSNDHYLKIEYSGEINFNDAGTAIQSISRNGYVEYQNDNKKLEARNDGRGGISYELYDGYDKLPLDSKGKAFIASAVRTMIEKTRHR
ncbi:MAG TPA: hypothetical protein VL442_10440 [Mucilaginibacter sp.]|nr:hypothetical protein [Mucilaginibacter sp.]